jgi:hypothetical protein
MWISEWLQVRNRNSRIVMSVISFCPTLALVSNRTQVAAFVWVPYTWPPMATPVGAAEVFAGFPQT